MEEAIDFINRHGTGHSESIITKNYFKAQHFLDQVDAAAVYVNASTRFTDGGEFGLGAEIGISTQKMHARGPMGPRAWSFWVEMPISQPRPNSPPSVNRVEALM